VVFLSKGRVVSSDSIESISSSLEHGVVDVKFLRPLSREEIEKLRAIELVRSVDVNDNTARLRYDGQPMSSVQILRRLVSSNFDVVSYNVESAGLEDYYVSVMSDEKGAN
jgi:ABC-type multidrug transport system ATPase subunit